MKIAITTPAGHVGGAVTRALLDAGADVVLIARHPEKLAVYKTRGARIVQASQDDRNEILRATEGVDALFWVTPPNFEARHLRTWQGLCTEAGVAAVQKHRIPWVVTLSSVGAHLPGGTGPVTGLHDAEKGFESVTSNVLHLRPVFFMENYGMHLGTAQSQGQVYLPVPANGRTALIAAEDIARYAAGRLRNPGTGRQVVGLRGPDQLTWGGAAETLGQALGRPVQHVQVTAEQAYDAMTGMGVGESTTRAFLELYSAAEQGLLVQEPGTPEVVTSTPFATWCRKATLEGRSEGGDNRGRSS